MSPVGQADCWFLDAFDAATGLPVLRRPVALDVGTSAANLSSAGVAVADHTVFVAASASAATAEARSCRCD